MIADKIGAHLNRDEVTAEELKILLPLDKFESVRLEVDGAFWTKKKGTWTISDAYGNYKHVKHTFGYGFVIVKFQLGKFRRSQRIAPFQSRVQDFCSESDKEEPNVDVAQRGRSDAAHV